MDKIKDTKVVARMAAAMEKIVGLSSGIAKMEKVLNADRIALALQIHDWVFLATESEALPTAKQAYIAIARKSGMAEQTVANYARIGAYVNDSANKIDATTVSFGAVWQLLCYRKRATKATQLKVAAAVRNGASRHQVARMLAVDNQLQQSLAHKRAELTIGSDKLTRDSLKIEMMAVQTMAKRLFNKDCVISVTDQDFTPLLTVGAKRMALA